MKRLWKWLRNVLDETATWIDLVARRFEDAALWIQVNKVAEGKAVNPQLVRMLEQVYEPPSPLWNEPLNWGDPPMWLCTCPMRIADGDPKVRPVTPTCPVHDPAKPIGGLADLKYYQPEDIPESARIPYYQVESTDIPGLERHPYPKPPKGV